LPYEHLYSEAFMSVARLTAAWAAIAVVAVGCDSGPPMAEVSGAVTYDGKLIEKGNIAFFPRSEERLHG
jgi:hypothetical protein